MPTRSPAPVSKPNRPAVSTTKPTPPTTPAAKNEYLLTIRLTTKKALDPEAVRRIESQVADLLRNTIWEASGVVSIKGNLWGRHGEGQL